MDNERKIEILQKKLNKAEQEVRNLRAKNTLIHCEECDTYHDDLEGARQPDYEGYCPNCHNETNWRVYYILDDRETIKDILNDGGIR